MQTVTFRRCMLLLALGVAGCAAPPARDTQVVVMNSDALPAEPGLPPPGTTWRLDEHVLLALSPAPYAPPPAQPIPAPPPALSVVPVVPYPAPYPYFWGAPYYGPAFGFSFGYSNSHYPHHRHRRR